jgi:TIR domain
MNPILSFLSYSHKDRLLAGSIRDAFWLYGISAFLAHEDIQPSQEWQDEISRTLHACEVFFPLLTDSFHGSDWTDQETGIAVALNKIIVPLKATLNPYGFIGRYQAQAFPGEKRNGALNLPGIDENCWKVVRSLARRSDIGNRIKTGIIAKFSQSAAFKEASQYASRLHDLEPFDLPQVEEIVRASCRNNQIHGSFAARDYVRSLMKRNRFRVSGELSRNFRHLTSVSDSSSTSSAMA